jgi:hypothetical protein
MNMAWRQADHKVELDRQLLQIDPAGGPPNLLMVADCQGYGFWGEMDRACVVDSDGKSYGLAGGNMIITSATPPYGVFFLFNDSYAPLAEDISTVGADASVKVCAAPYNVELPPSCSETDQITRVAQAVVCAAWVCANLL